MKHLDKKKEKEKEGEFQEKTQKKMKIVRKQQKQKQIKPFWGNSMKSTISKNWRQSTMSDIKQKEELLSLFYVKSSLKSYQTCLKQTFLRSYCM